MPDPPGPRNRGQASGSAVAAAAVMAIATRVINARTGNLRSFGFTSSENSPYARKPPLVSWLTAFPNYQRRRRSGTALEAIRAIFAWHGVAHSQCFAIQCKNPLAGFPLVLAFC